MLRSSHVQARARRELGGPVDHGGRRTRRDDHRSADAGRLRGELRELHVVADLAQQFGEPDTERVADRREQLGARLLLPTLHLGQVAKRHPRRGRHLTQRAALVLAATTERLTDHASEQDHRASSFVHGWVSPYTHWPGHRAAVYGTVAV